MHQQFNDKPFRAKLILETLFLSPFCRCVLYWHSIIVNYGYVPGIIVPQYPKHTFRHMRPAKIQLSLRIRAVWSESSQVAF